MCQRLVSSWWPAGLAVAGLLGMVVLCAMDPEALDKGSLSALATVVAMGLAGATECVFRGVALLRAAWRNGRPAAGRKREGGCQWLP